MKISLALLITTGVLGMARAGDPDDGRKVAISATDAGRDLIVETRRRRDAWLFRRLDGLSADERELLTNAAIVLRGIADS